jgi:uncharacterized membrane protein
MHMTMKITMVLEHYKNNNNYVNSLLLSFAGIYVIIIYTLIFLYSSTFFNTSELNLLFFINI